MTSESDWRGDVGAGARAWAGERPPDVEHDGPDADAESVARTILLDALTGQARSRRELRDKLAKKDVPDDLAERLLDRFTEVGLVDDEAFARSWVESRQRSRGLARRALAQELRRKGVDDETARTALDDLDPEDEDGGRPHPGPQEAPVVAWGRPRDGDPTPGRHARPQGLPGRDGVRGGARGARRCRRRRGIRHDGPVTAHLHRLPLGPVDLSAIPTDETPGFDGGKKGGTAALASLGEEMPDLQERLWAERGTGSRRRILLVLQGMDTSGKGGVLRHTVGLVDPQGVKITSFKAPTPEERKHDFLWRVRHALPEPGYVGVFDRSHYEDVLIVRVHELRRRRTTIERRYDEINEFEAELVADGVVIVKCMLHVSADEQKERLLARLDERGQVLEVQPQRHRRARALGRLPHGVRDRAGAHQHRARPVVRRAGGQEVVPQPGHRPAPARAPARHEPAVAARRLRRRRAASPPARGEPDRVIETVRVTRYVTPLREGGSLPGIVEGDDLGTYVCKFRGAGQGVRVLVAEVIVSALASRLGLRTPRPGRARPRSGDRPLRGRRGGPGPAQRQPRAQPRHRLPARRVRLRGTRPARRPDVAARILWLDAFTANVDRTWRNPNLLALARRRLGDRPRRVAVLPPRLARRASPTRPGSPPSRGTSATTCSAGTSTGCRPSTPAVDADRRPTLAACVAEVPDAWLEPVPGAETPDALRAAYVAFLSARLATRAWLPGASAA